jgi:hypothetical protein
LSSPVFLALNTANGVPENMHIMFEKWRPARVFRTIGYVQAMDYCTMSSNVILSDTRCHRFFRIRGIVIARKGEV